jgi:Fic-DOC domain mobile mystery protein B
MEFDEILPGETPIDDISGLKRKDVRNRRQLAVAEAENVRKVIVKYLAGKPNRKMAPFDVSWSLKLHKEMFGEVWNWAGQLRQVDLNIGVAWNQVAVALKDLFDDLAFWKDHWPDLIEQSAYLHHRAVRIHPFLNGNGRWARMLANIWLALHDHPITFWPEQTIGTVSTIRDEYLDAIRSADEGHMDALLELHNRFSQEE